MNKKDRPIEIVGDIAYVPLNNGDKVIIDAVDVPLIKDYSWCLLRQGTSIYAVSRTKNGNFVQMRRLIAGIENDLGDKDFVKNINGNNLDNRRNNLTVIKRNNKKIKPKQSYLDFKPQYCNE